MDPRPYNYQFRRPRLDNPTYQSLNAYESLYHMGRFNTNMLYNNSLMKDEHNYRLNLYKGVKNQVINSNHYQDQNTRQAKRYQDMYTNTDNIERRAQSNRSSFSERSKSSVGQNQLPIQPQKSSILSNYGSNSLDKNKGQITLKRDSISKDNDGRYAYVKNATSDIFQKQQKPFDIINCFPRYTIEPLQKFPKLTLENKLYERGIGLPNPQSQNQK